MTDQVQDQAAPTMEGLEVPEVKATPDEMRNHLFKTVTDAYMFLMQQIIVKLPIANQIKGNAVTRFDEGFLWIKEGINCLKFPEEMPVPAENQEAPAADVAPTDPTDPTVVAGDAA